MPVQQYVSYPYVMSSKGLQQRYTIDRMGDHCYWNHGNAESRQENSIASRLGHIAITTNGTNNSPLADANIVTLARLKGLSQGYRYAGAGQNLYRSTDATNVYTKINGSALFSGNPFSSAVYRPTNSSYPYIFFADSQQMQKDNGSLSQTQQWGIFPPTAPPQLSLLQFEDTIIDGFDDPPADYSSSGFSSGPASITIVNTTLGTAITSAPGIFTVTPGSMTNIIPNAHLTVGAEPSVIVISTTATTFTAYFNNNHAASDVVSNMALEGTVPASTKAAIQRAGSFDFSMLGGSAATDSDQFNIGLSFTEPPTQVLILFDVGDGSFTQSYYYAIIEGTVFTGTTAFQEIQVSRGSFIPVGQAGLAGHSWANVNAWQIQVVNGTSITTGTFNDFYFFGGAGPNVSDGVDYDYRITFYNINTGVESGPSVVMVETNWAAPISQPVLVNWSDAVTGVTLDPQITHVRLYRRGGTLPNQWLQVAQVPIGTNTFVDTLSDQDIAANNILDVDTAPPITSTLPVPVNTTLGADVTAGSVQTVALASTLNVYPNQVITVDPLTSSPETVIVRSVSGSNITAYFQLNHNSGAIVQATTRTGAPAYIATIAFDQAWVAGDPNNPNLLYYSDRFNPESFPLENYLEIGTPSDPIMGIVEWNGQLYVFTVNTVWNILGVGLGSTVPLPYKTAADHGLAAPFGFTVTEGEIFYQSFGGIYAFTGAASNYVSEPIEWIFTYQFISDSISRPVPPMNPTFVSQTIMAYYQNEVYISYVGIDGNRYRVIWHKIYKRWRNDTIQANAMIVQEDLYTFLFARTNGMIYQDRTGNYDSNGYSGGLPQNDPLNFNLQTAALDLGMPKNFKVFNEFTVDIDTGGQAVAITLWFDYGLTPVSLGTVNTTGRQQVDFQIQSGQGQLSLNVSAQFTGTISGVTTNPITVYEVHIRATPEAELRRSYDSYLMDFGSPDYKIWKQGWFEYMSLDAAGITFSCYVEGKSTPSFTFNLPQSLTRASLRVRFPATKGRVSRWVATSSSDFRLYSDSRIEYNRVTKDKGYTLLPLQRESPQQP